jgi:histidine triad (HIT) family protein
MCIFCDIVCGKLPASVVYEDEDTLAFMDLHQAHPGHVLIIPKKHVETIDQLTPNLASALFPVVVLLSRAVKAAFKPDGLSVFQSNGQAAMQEIPHVHIHIIPRYYHDGIMRFYTKGAPTITERENLDKWAAQIRDQLL